MGINYVNCLSADADALWCGTKDGLISPSIAFRENYVRPPSSGLNNQTVLSLEVQTGQKFPLCGTTRGLYIHDGSDWRKEIALGDREIRCLLRTKDTLWCGTNRGLFRQIHDQWQLIESDHELPSPTFNCLSWINDQLWCGTEDGLATFNGSHFSQKLLGINILCLQQDIHGTIWCGTASGLLCLPRQGSWSCSLEVRDRIECLREDSKNILWCGTRKGLWKISEQCYQSLPEMNQDISCLLEWQGQLWCGGRDGIKALDLGTSSSLKPASIETQQVFDSQLRKLQEYVDASRFDLQNIYEEKLSAQAMRIKKLEGFVIDLHNKFMLLSAHESPVQVPNIPSLGPQNDSVIQILSPTEDKAAEKQPQKRGDLPNTDAKTQERVDFFNQLLRQSLPDIKKGLSQSMSAMAIDFEAYQTGEVYLNENKTGIFYAVANLNKRYEVYYDPGFPVTQTQIKSVYDVSGVGNFVKRLIEPAIFDGDSAQQRIKLIQKGKLIA